MGEVKKYLTATEIIEAKDIEIVDVDVPEWGGIVRLRAMSGEEAVTFVESLKGQLATSSARIIASCAVDEDGKHLFTFEQVEQIKKKSLKAIMRLQKEALRINGLTEEGTAATKNA